MYCALTSENRVLSIELTGSTTAFVREFVNFDTINEYTGIDVNTTQNDPYTAPNTSTSINHPDNLAIGPSGKVYIIEDAFPGDIWKAIDADKDGVAESIALWASLGVDGTEPSGLIVDPNNPNRFLVVVQHPTSEDEALWFIEGPSRVWVDFAHTSTELGTQARPYNTAAEGINNIQEGGVVTFNYTITKSSSLESMLITRPMRLESDGGTVRIGSDL